MTEIGRGLPAGSDLVPGWLVRLAAIGWRLLATILLGLVLLVHRARAGDRHGFDPARRDRGGDVRSLRPRLAEPRLVADQGSGRRLPWRRAGHRRHPGHHRPRVPALCRAIPGCAEHRPRDAPGEAGRPVHPSGDRVRDQSGRQRHPGLVRGLGARGGRGCRHSRDRRDPGHVPDLLLHDGRRQGVGLGALVGQHLAPRRDHDQWPRRPRAGRRLPARDRDHRRVRRRRGGTLPGPPWRAPGRSARGHRLLRAVHPVHRRLGDDDHPVDRHRRIAGNDRRPDPAGPDRDPERHPGQVHRAGRLSQDRAHPSGARADRPPGGGRVGRDRRAVRGDPGGRLRPGRDPRSGHGAGRGTGAPCAGCERDRPGLARPARAVQLASARLACASRRCHRRRCPGADRRDPARPGGRPRGDTHAARRLPSATRLAAGSRCPGIRARGDHRGHRHHRPDAHLACRISQRDARQRDDAVPRPSTRTPAAKPASWCGFVQAAGERDDRRHLLGGLEPCRHRGHRACCRSS